MNTQKEGAVRAKGVLLPWQKRLYGLLLIPLGLMAANSIYLVAFTKISSFFMGMLLMHLVLGSLIAIPFLVFAFTHGARMLANIRNRKAKAAGITIVALALTCIGTGVFMAFKGATLTNRPVYLAHAFAIPAALVAFVLHRRAAVHKLHLTRLFQWGGAVAAFLAGMAVLHKLEKPPQRIVNREGDTQFFLSSAETFDQGLLDGKKLAANTYCQECHPDSFKRWEKSAHRFSSFNNPFYRRAVELMADQVGREKTKWCAGCHDPVVLFTGQMGKATMASFSYDQFEAQQGLTCMACHSIAEVKDVRGNGGYVVEESKQYPFAFTGSKALKEVNKLLIRMEPSLHRQTFMKPFMRTPEFCATCHKVALLPPMNGYRWLRGQNHYDSWQDSGVSGYAVRSFYDPPKAKACRDCHLPLMASQEFGNQDGKLHDHLFPAANTALPAIRGDEKTIEEIRTLVLEKSLSIDVFAIKRDGRTIPLGPALPAVRPGETVDAEVVVRTRTLGHPYTNGTADSNETWVEFHAKNGDRSLMESGTLDANRRLDPAASKLNQLVIAHDGTPMDRRQPQDIHVPLYNNAIGPGAARVVHYRFKVPVDAKGSVTLSASANYRKFSRDYSIFVHGKDAIDIPVTRISADTVTLPVAPAPEGTLAIDVKRGNPDWPERGDPLERLWDRPSPAGRPQGGVRRLPEGRRPREGQAGWPVEPRAREDPGRRPARREGRARRGRDAPPGLAEDGLFSVARLQGGRPSRRRARRPRARGPEIPEGPRRPESEGTRALPRGPLRRRSSLHRPRPRDRRRGPCRSLQRDAVPSGPRPHRGSRGRREVVPLLQGRRVVTSRPRRVQEDASVRQP